MVPYVRKSFYKHYKNGIVYLLECDDLEKGYILKELSNDMPIESEEYKKNKKVYTYAMNMTIKEVHQAVEGLFHNLNTL